MRAVGCMANALQILSAPQLRNYQKVPTTTTGNLARTAGWNLTVLYDLPAKRSDSVGFGHVHALVRMEQTPSCDERASISCVGHRWYRSGVSIVRLRVAPSHTEGSRRNDTEKAYCPTILESVHHSERSPETEWCGGHNPI